MSAEVNWLLEGYILHTHVYGKIVEEDINTIFDRGFALIDASPHAPVHTIIDADLDEMPSLAMLSKMGRQRTTNPKSGWSMIVIPASPVVRFAADIMAQMIKVKYRRVDSIEQALAFLKDFDPEIDWSGLPELYKVTTP